MGRYYFERVSMSRHRKLDTTSMLWLFSSFWIEYRLVTSLTEFLHPLSPLSTTNMTLSFLAFDSAISVHNIKLRLGNCNLNAVPKCHHHKRAINSPSNIKLTKNQKCAPSFSKVRDLPLQSKKSQIPNRKREMQFLKVFPSQS
jgi:hypothetical protein